MLSEVADGVWVRQSEWVWSNAVVVRRDEPVDARLEQDWLAGPHRGNVEIAGREEG